MPAGTHGSKWDKQSKAAIYSVEAARACLSCPYRECLDPDRGCERFRAAYRAAKHPSYAHVGRRRAEA